jgi:hypothetical protein
MHFSDYLIVDSFFTHSSTLVAFAADPFLWWIGGSVGLAFIVAHHSHSRVIRYGTRIAALVAADKRNTEIVTDLLAVVTTIGHTTRIDAKMFCIKAHVLIACITDFVAVTIRLQGV